MKFIKSKQGECHENYLARVINVTEDDFTPHPNPEVTKLKRCKVGVDTLYNVIVHIDSTPGKYVFFPALSQINPEFLRYANLYRDPAMNANSECTGMFENNGRVKTIRIKGTRTIVDPSTGIKSEIRLSGAVSDGFLIELDVVLGFITSTFNVACESNDIQTDVWFDTIEHNGKSFWLSRKYIIKTQQTRQQRSAEHTQKSSKHGKQKKKKRFNRVIDNQFNYHYDTVLVKKVPFAVQPDDYIHVSSKVHGTSFIVSNVICNEEPITWKDKIIKFLTGKNLTAYDFLYASRTKIKNQYIDDNGPTFNGCDIWKYAYDVVKPNLPKGYTVYGEIIGFLPSGSYIQKGYDYGCVPPVNGEEFTHEKHYKVRVYRVTITNPDGIVHEFTPREVQTWCIANNLTPVTELYYGKAKDLYPDLDITANWHQNFWDRMADDTNFYMEMKSPDCVNNVPHEGVVIKIDDNKSRAFKLKTFMFVNGESKQLDNGETNIEDEQGDE